MKVILTTDVPKLGDMGTIQEVKSGFARNYLIPEQLAQFATPGMIKQVEQRQDAERRRIANLEEELRELADAIEGVRIEVHARVGEQGRLFGSVTSADIAERLSAEVGQDVDRKNIELDAPIRTVGEVKVPVRLIGRLVPTITVAVFDPSAPLLAEELASESEDADSDESDEVQAAAEIEAVEDVEPETEEAAAIPTAEPEELVDEADDDADESDDPAS